MRSERSRMLTIRRVVIAFWVVAALWVIRDITADDDTKGMNQGELVDELEHLGD